MPHAFTMMLSERRVIALALLGCCILLMISGCTGDGEESGITDDSVVGPASLIVLWRMPGYPGPDDPVVSGPVAMLWADHSLLRSTNPEKPSGTFVYGRVLSQDMGQLLEEIDQVLAMEHGESMVVIDAPSLHMTIERGMNRLTIAESLPMDSDSPLARLRDHLFRLELADTQTVESGAHQEAPFPAPNE